MFTQNPFFSGIGKQNDQNHVIFFNIDLKDEIFQAEHLVMDATFRSLPKDHGKLLFEQIFCIMALIEDRVST